MGAYSISKTKVVKKEDLEKILKIKLNQRIILATFHPVTLEKYQSGNQIKNLIRFLNSLNNYIIIFTSPNFDNETQVIKKEIIKFLKKKKIFIILTP